MKARTVWKALGVAGIAGVAATGVVVARAERRRRAYSAEDVRARLHERHARAEAAGPAAAQHAGGATAVLAERRGCAGRLRGLMPRRRR